MQSSKILLTALVGAVFASGHAFAQSSSDQAVDDIIAASAQNVKRWEQENQGRPVLPGAPAQKPTTTTAPKAVPQAKAPALRPSLPSAEPQNERPQGWVDEDESAVTYYFVSLSMPKPLLADAIKSLGKNEVVVFRGPLPGENLVDLYRRLTEILEVGADLKAKERFAGQLAMQIDPPRFRQCAIKAVPATCIMTPNGPISAHGILSGDYLRRRGQGSDRAVGQTWQIAEIDLEAEIKRRIMAITPEDFQRETIKSVFLNRQYVKLPRTQQDSAFQFDPSVVRVEPMIVAGRMIAPAGQKFNPIAGGFDHSYVVFDATDTRQIDTATRLVAELDAQKKSVRVMVTDFPSHNEGFRVINDLMQRFGRKVTIIDDVLAKVLRLRALPSVVESTPEGIVVINEVRP